MISMYLGIFAFCIGTILVMTMFAKKVAASGDVPTRLKIGLFLVIVGGLLICVGAVYMVLTDPASLLGFQDFMKSS